MQLTYVLVGAIVILILVIVFLAVSMSGLRKDLAEANRSSEEVRRDIEETRRDISEIRKENAQTLSGGLSEISRTLSDTTMQQDRRMEYLRATMENRLNALQNDNAIQMEKIRATVDEKLQNTLDERLSNSFKQVRESLDRVYRGIGEMQGLAQDVGDLRKIMTNVKSRGIIGELQLGSILEQIMAPGQYLENTPVRPGASERVEFAVVMPGSGEEYVLLPIDSKFPGDVYAALQDAYENADAQAAEAARKQLAAFIKTSAKEIRDKYIVPPFTTEFGVMFLPFEGLYAEVVNMELMEICQREYKIMIAGPSTMAAMLNSLQMGFRALAIQKHSGEVWKVLGAVKGEFDKFADTLAKAQNRLNQANSELDQLIGTRTRKIQKTLEDIQRLGEPDEDMGDR